jgi:hypothetical protein
MRDLIDDEEEQWRELGVSYDMVDRNKRKHMHKFLRQAVIRIFDNHTMKELIDTRQDLEFGKIIDEGVEYAKDPTLISCLLAMKLIIEKDKKGRSLLVTLNELKKFLSEQEITVMEKTSAGRLSYYYWHNFKPKISKI